MPEQIPPTQKGQIDALLAALGVSDVTAAIAAIPQLKASAGSADQWKTQQQELFAALGGTGNVPEHYDFATGITALKKDHAALMTSLGATDQAGAVLALDNLRTENNNLKAVQTSMFGALKATDHAGAMRAIKDIDDRIEAGVTAGVIARAASAGITEPVKKPAGVKEGAAKTSLTRAEFATMSPKQQLEFSKAGGVLTEAAA